MCAVSIVTGGWIKPQSPNYVPWTTTTPDAATAAQMLKVIALLEQIDKKLDAKDCSLEAKEKAALKRKLARRAKKG